ncbi:hypothetical protein [Methylobacterium gregans]|uniref:DUF308 domain-containing protein n=1 Tax=Methylobacterium gregans TaxID=374424 RepID=A0AA37MDB7_9HYPH|nr:hypothetical protein [Methylobacterium gregans]MDQ0523533.1 hypothetical protein [Methylobacterium gregans]GJD80281.1 hypothetical protein NBEOAGPD_3522 [Methylobacterium gregans]GLS55882.1 hypothetical protein GCM10007886_40670 [Methylobacterium gregans]
MIVALFALAAAMVIGGSAAVVQGFPFVRLESGLAMVIAGSVAASAGAVLGGLGVVAVYLRRVERGLGSRPVPVPTALPPFPDLPRAELPRAEASAPRPVLPAALGAAAGLGGAALAANGRRQAEPTFEDTLFEPAPPEPAREPELPMPGLEPKPPQPADEPVQDTVDPQRAGAESLQLPQPGVAAERPAEPDGAGPEDGLFARPEAAEPGRPELRPSLDAAEEPAEPSAPEPEPEPEPAPPRPNREVVGKYASGGNTYVMFADGSIEAETPQGRFTFASLDELKAFVDAGGERSSRGAA